MRETAPIDLRQRAWQAVRRPRGWLALLLAPALLACVAWQFAGPFALALGDAAGADVVSGFYAPETGALGVYRWSTPTAAITLPARRTPAVLELRGALAPDRTRVTLMLAGRAALALPPAEALTPRRFLLLWPGDASAGLAQLTLAATPPERRADARPLGLALSAVALRPLPGALGLPPPAALLALVLLPALLAACLGAIGAGRALACALAAAAGTGAVLAWWTRPLAVQPLLLDAAASLGASAVQRWLAALLLLGLAGAPIAAFLLRTLPLRGLLLARVAGYVLVGWLSWYASAALLIPFGPASVLGAALLLAGLSCWGLRAQGLRDLAALVRGSWRALLAGETLFLAAFLAGLWLRWNGAVGPAIAGTEKPMDLALLQGVLRDPRFPPVDLWFSGHSVNYYYLGYVQVAAVARLAGVTPGEAFNLGMATLFGLTALAVAALVASLCALDRRRQPRSDAGIAAAALLGVALVLLAGNQVGALQLVLGGSQARVLDGGQLAEALWQRLGGATTIRLSRPTPPAPDFGALAGWTPAASATFDWWSPSRIVMDDIATPAGVERRPAITEFPFFSFYLGDLHAHVLALPQLLLIAALALAVLARPTLPVYFVTPRGWLELVLSGATLGSLYALNAWDAPGAWLLFAGALALLYHRSRETLDLRSLLVHAALVGLGLVAVTMAAAGPFMSSYRSPFGGADGPQPWAGVPLLASLGRVLGPAPAHTGLHSFLAIFGLFVLPLVALALAGLRGARQEAGIDGRVQQMLVSLRRSPFGQLWLLPALWALALVTLALGAWRGFPLLALLPLALAWALAAARSTGRPALALALWGAAVAALAVLAADSVYVRDQLEGSMSRYITVFKLYFHAWVLWGTLAAYAVWALAGGPKAEDRGPPAERGRLITAGLRSLVLGLFALLLVGALVYPLETLRRGRPWAPPARAVDGLALLARTAPAEGAAIAWLSANAGADDVVLTGWCACAPDDIGRVAAASGVPTLLGRSEGHQRLWRAGSPAWLAEIAARERDIPLIYSGAAGARALLVRYGVDYVYVGATERKLYGGAGLDALAALLEPAFAEGDVRIYRVPQAVP